MKFNDYAIIGDFVEYTPTENNPREFVIRATIMEDFDSSPSDFYSEEETDSWERDIWFFCGVVLSVYKAGVCLTKQAASLWGIECNFPGTSNDYLLDVIKELETEALQAGESILQKLID